MNRKRMWIGAFFLIFTIVSSVTATEIKKKISTTDDSRFFLEKDVKPSIVCAITVRNCEIFNDIATDFVIDRLSENEKIIVLQDRSCQWYLIEKDNGKRGWVKAENIAIEPDEPVNKNTLSKERIEEYVNSNDFKSDTNYFVWVDIDRQRVNILKKNGIKWELEKEFECATGKNISPTVRGFFKTGNKGDWFYSKRLSSGAKYWVQFYNSYLFHSVAMDINKNITDPIIGEKRSSGCVRFSVENAKWFFDNIPKGTAVFVN